MMKRKGIVLTASFILIAGLLSCGGGSSTRSGGNGGSGDAAAKNRGRAKGVATIFYKDTALARDRALNDARNKVVEKILGSRIFGQSLMQDFEMVSHVVKSESSGLLRDEEIVDEGVMGGNMYHITIEATVEKAAIADAISTALDRYGKPKLMVLVTEQFLGKNSRPGFTQTELVIQEKFGDVGFEFVDAAITKKLMREQRRKMAKAMQGQMGDDVKELLLGDNVADIVILGTAITTDQSHAIRKWSKTMNSHRAFVKLKAIDIYTGRVLAVSPSIRANGVHINTEEASTNAIEKALWKVVGKRDASGKFVVGPFMNNIIKKFTKAATNREINLTVVGLDRQAMTKFRDKLKQYIRGVNQVISRGQVGAASKVDVYFVGKTDAFLDELDAKSEKLGFQIKVQETFPNRAILRAKLVE